tara:strand:- start:984 stop:1148 length:165 start_codon:yes stop_codon:yes gene_type:complete
LARPVGTPFLARRCSCRLTVAVITAVAAVATIVTAVAVVYTHASKIAIEYGALT